MKKLSLPVITDTVFTFIISFLFSLVIANYFLKFPVQIVFALTVSLTASLIALKIFITRKAKKDVRITDQREYCDVMTRLDFMTKPEIASLFSLALSKKGLTVENKRKYLQIPQKKLLVFFFFGFVSVEKKDIVLIFNSLPKDYSASIVSEDFSIEIKSFAQRFDGKFRLTDGKSVYSFLKETGCLPTNSVPLSAETTPSQRRKNSITNLINKKRAKNYLVFGISFMLLSYFVPIKTYYVVCGSIMLIIALFVRFFGKTSNKPD